MTNDKILFLLSSGCGDPPATIMAARMDLGSFASRPITKPFASFEPHGFGLLLRVNKVLNK